MFFLVLAGTGCVMAFESEIDSLFHPSPLKVIPHGDALSLGEMLPRVAAELRPQEDVQNCVTSAKPTNSYPKAQAESKKCVLSVRVESCGVFAIKSWAYRRSQVSLRVCSFTPYLKEKSFQSAVLQKIMATPEGLEPPTYWFEANRSIQLSYGVSIWILLRRSVSCLVMPHSQRSRGSVRHKRQKELKDNGFRVR